MNTSEVDAYVAGWLVFTGLVIAGVLVVNMLVAIALMVWQCAF